MRLLYRLQKVLSHGGGYRPAYGSCTGLLQRRCQQGLSLIIDTIVYSRPAAQPVAASCKPAHIFDNAMCACHL